MRSTPESLFHNDHDPDLAQVIDDFLAELDRLLPDEPPADTKESK